MYDYTQNPLYNPMINPYLNAQQPYRQQPKQEVVKVNGENGARAFPLGANSSALLLDESGEIVWLVTTDGAGYKTVAPFDISPHENPAFIDDNAFLLTPQSDSILPVEIPFRLASSLIMFAISCGFRIKSLPIFVQTNEIPIIWDLFLTFPSSCDIL